MTRALSTRLNCQRSAAALTLACMLGVSLLLDACTTTTAGRTTPSSATAASKAISASGTLAGQPSANIPDQTNAQALAVDPATGTLYVVAGPDHVPGTLTAVNALTCDALHGDGCGPTTAYVQVGFNPVGVAVDQATDTIYVANFNSKTVSVINGATCNARYASECSQAAATVQAGSEPTDVGVDQATDTVYVADWGKGSSTTVQVINGRTCNGQVTSGCRQAPARVHVGTAPAGVFVDQATDAIYVGTVAKSGAETVWAIDGATCNAVVTVGCGALPPSVAVGKGSADFNVGFALDQVTGTLYVTNWADNTLSMIDTNGCNATTRSGCAHAPQTVLVGRGPDSIAVNPATHTVYVSNITDNTLSVLNAATCNAKILSGCSPYHAQLLRTGHAPQSVAVDPATATVYVANADDATVSVFDAATCNAVVASGCSPAPPPSG
jgi:DNA-binding beta-propeller fold protein YncE